MIIDGLYHHRLAVRHKEILSILEREVRVIGAASIGALRAVELERFGMVGIGRIFGWYRDGLLDNDDAVAVAHDDAPGSPALSIPLVNVRAALADASSVGIVDVPRAQAVYRELESLYYPLRTRRVVLSVMSRIAGPEVADWYRAALTADPRADDQKYLDCLEAVGVAYSGSGDRPSHLEDANCDTELFRRWSNFFACGSDESALHHRLAYQQIMKADFPATWWSYLESSVRADPVTQSSSMRDYLSTELGQTAATWSDDGPQRTHTTSLLCPTPNLRNPAVAALLLQGETAEDRAAVERFLDEAGNHVARNPGRSVRLISPDACQRLLTAVWLQHGDFGTQWRLRGFRSEEHAINSVRPLAIGLSLAATRS